MDKEAIQNLKNKCIEMHNAGGLEAVDHYLDQYYRLIPWEMCYDCDEITPRDPINLTCFFKEEMHESV